MSETLLTYVIVFAELGGVLLLLALAAAIFFFVKNKKEGKDTKSLMNLVKTIKSSGRDNLKNLFENEFDSKNNTDISVDTLMADEQQLYQHLVKLSIDKDINLLSSTTSGIHSLINNYIQLLSSQLETEGEGTSAVVKESKDLSLKKENEALRIELASLEARLQNATDTIESMMGEFSSMYEGGKKEGEQRVKNEMYKLKQSLDGEEAKVKADLKKLDLDLDKK